MNYLNLGGTKLSLLNLVKSKLYSMTFIYFSARYGAGDNKLHVKENSKSTCRVRAQEKILRRSTWRIMFGWCGGGVDANQSTTATKETFHQMNFPRHKILKILVLYQF